MLRASRQTWVDRAGALEAPLTSADHIVLNGEDGNRLELPFVILNLNLRSPYFANKAG